MIIVDIEAHDLGEIINTKVCDELQAAANNGMYRFIKVNLLNNDKETNSEGCWALVSSETYAIEADDNNYNTECKAILLNDSVFYSRLKYGTIIPFITNGKKRPFVSLDWLKNYR